MTDNGGWQSRGVEKMCPRCQEDRLVIETIIFGRTSYYCEVCSYSWVPSQSVCDINGVVMYDP